MNQRLRPIQHAFRKQAGQCQSRTLLRRLYQSGNRCAAQNFSMPAMSPTMTEGNIAAWKIEEGQSFAAGDVLLEIETDKAQMEVEAQDDGVMAKIVHPSGSKGVKVGTRIAVVAEPGDDIHTLKIPTEASANLSQGSQGSGSITASPPKAQSTLQSQSSGISQAKEGPLAGPIASDSSLRGAVQKDTGMKHSRAYPLYPSVIQLLHQNGLDQAKARQIPATGPNGRLLKGDVLAFVGAIESTYPRKQSERLANLSHLNLSGIKRITPKEPARSTLQKQESSKPLPSSNTKITVAISLAAVKEVQQRVHDALGIDMPLKTFISRAIEASNIDLPRPGSSRAADELFDQILGLDSVRSKRSRAKFSPRVIDLSSSSSPVTTAKPDVIDVVAGRSGKGRSKTSHPPQSSKQDKPVSLFSLVVSEADKERGKIFMERMKTMLQVDPGRLVL